MKFASHKLSILTLGLAFLAGAQTASAGFSTEVQTVNFGSPGSPLITSFTGTPTFSLFDSTQGTLTAVTIALSDQTTVSSNIVNNGAEQVYYTVSSSNLISVTGPSNSGFSFTTLSSSPVSGYLNGGGSALFGVGLVGPQAGSSSSNVSSGSLGLYESVGGGTSTLSLNGSASVTGSYTGGGSDTVVGFTGVGTAYGTITITYTYNAVVPEPASVAMVAIGLGGLFIARRVRRRIA